MTIISLGALGARGLAIRGNGNYAQLGLDVSDAGDVNNDGLADFIVSAAYSADGHAPGEVYLIFGKTGGLGPIDLADLDVADGILIQGESNGFQSHFTGEALSSAGDINGDGYDDILIGAARFNNNNGRIYVLFGKAHGFTDVALGSLDPEDGFTITSTLFNGWAGQTLSAAGDINDDGYDDFLIGSDSNRAYVIFGKADGLATMALDPFDPANGFFVESGTAGDKVGGGVAGLGDFNGDGIDDFAVGAYGINKVYVLFGKAAGLANVNVGSLTAADGFIVPGGHPHDFLGFGMSTAGDVNGDGLQDMILGTNQGKAYVVFGRPGGTLDIDLNNLGTGGFVIQSASIYLAVSAAGDMNGDGYDDVIVGATLDQRGGTNAGGAFVVYGKANWSGTVNADLLPDADGFFLQGEGAEDRTAREVSSAGDVNGDGFDDVLVGATANDTPPAFAVGAAFLVYGEMPTGDVVRIGTIAAQTLAGGLGSDSLSGLGGDDRLFGNSGDDLLDGGLGEDGMKGGGGDDIYIVDNAGDLVEENPGEGADEVRTSLPVYVLAANVENLTGTSAAGQTLTGNSGDNLVAAGTGNDMLHLWAGGGNDTVLGGAGNDNIFFGATLTSADVVNGGAGVDTLVVQGPYGSLTLTAAVTQIENVSILGGNNISFGEPGSNRYDYVLTAHDSNFAAGVQARINGAALLEGEDFTFDGSAETDAKFVVYGGKGRDTLTGGLGNDIFFYAEERFASGDTVNGGAGYDGMFLRGNYTIDFNAPGYTGLFTNIENLTLTSATDERYARGGGSEFDYDLTLSNAIVGAGQELTVSGALLMASETMILDASQETNGFLRLFGGRSADTLKGGALADLLHGNSGADTLAGGGGADVFRYQAVTESYSVARDHIIDFTPGTDRIDLAAIDASRALGGNQAFTWIGPDAFSASAGQLRAYQSGTQWIVEGDINGDGFADLVIAVTLQGPTPLGAGDFLL